MSSSLAKSKSKLNQATNLISTQSEPRRSSRSRRPSLHKLESDEYEAESQHASRAPTPSQPKSKRRPKNQHGEKGNRPGRIIQPAGAWTTQHSESPEPLTDPGSPPDGFDMESEGPQVKTISKADAIKRVSAHLGYDASEMPEDILKDVLEDIEVLETEADRSGPMEIEDGAFETLRQSPGRTFMGRRPEELAGEASDDINMSEELPQFTYPDARLLLGQAVSEAPRDDDTATEDSEEIELGPGDSVSQRVPQSKNLPSESLRPAPPQLDLAHNRVQNTKRAFDATADNPGDPPIPTKRPRAISSPLARVPRPSPAPVTDAPGSTSTNQHSIQRAPIRTTGPTSRIIFSAAPQSSSVLSSNLLNPPPTSNVDAVLAWATRMATKATNSHPVASTSHPGSQTNSVDNGDRYAQLASVLEDLRAHLAASAPKQHANQVRRLRHPRDTDFVEDDAELLEAEAALALGKRINAPRKPCLSDFPGFRRHIASNAIPDLVATLVTHGAFEVHGTTAGFAEDSYSRQWTEEIPDEPFQPPPRALLAIMVHRGSCFRSHTMDRIRPEVCHLWPFIRTPHTPNDLLYNKRLAKRLLPNQFHCRNTKTGEDPYEHPALQACINVALFWSPESIGASFDDRFRPLPLPSVAFVLTKMQHGIEELATGRFVKSELNVEQQRRSYEAHLLGLLEYDKKAPGRLVTFQEQWFQKGMSYSGANFTPDAAPYQAITRADQIREDTPVRDRIHQAIAKAKARAAY
ncbi:hypothetical protein RhiLY_10986 [Ceratobasidium sp. AG-Ba]|nr:hypothetical protein RhiLY_10986 [Ceratobasidium sp. AG-Ba]